MKSPEDIVTDVNSHATVTSDRIFIFQSVNLSETHLHTEVEIKEGIIIIPIIIPLYEHS